ncbi:MAG: hypothetical protein ABFS34_05540 [Gemmatimonadota bacterium]
MTQKRTTTAALLLLLAGTGCAASAQEPAPDLTDNSGGAEAAAIESAEQLVRAMHDRYADSWYRTLFFKQTVIRTPPEGEPPPDEVWTEYMTLPGQLRIDLTDGYNGSGAIFRGDSTYVFRNGALAVVRDQRNALLVLGFDVYAQEPEVTLEILGGIGFDLSVLRSDTWQGRPAWVVGAAEGDLTTPQFWIDAERLLFTRLIQPSPNGAGISDIRFDDYEPLAGGWIAPTVVFLTDGRETLREEYFDVEANPDLDPALYDPEAWGPPAG